MRRLAALLVVAVLVGGCAAPGSPTRSAPPPRPTPTAPVTALPPPSPTPARSPTPVPTPAIALGSWEALPIAAPHAAAASGVLAREGVVAVTGATGLDGDAWRGAIWLEAADGSWAEVSAPEVWRSLYLSDMAADLDGYVTVGTRVLEESLDPQTGLLVQIEGSVWRSTDLRRWTEAQRLPGADLAWVGVGEGGWVAAGGYAPGGARGCWHGCAGGVSLWWSLDGVRWEPAVREPDRAYRLVGIAYEIDAGWLAIARVLSEADDSVAVAAWRSPDGRTWTRADDPQGLAGVPVSGLATEPYGGFVALANDFDLESTGDASVFTSGDGLRWAPMPRGTPNLAGIAPLAEGFVAWQNLILDPAYGVWTSSDLAHWTQVEAYPEFYAERMVAAGNRLFATAGPAQASALWEAATPSHD